jgi:hypothetical protein
MTTYYVYVLGDGTEHFAGTVEADTQPQAAGLAQCSYGHLAGEGGLLVSDRRRHPDPGPAVPLTPAEELLALSCFRGSTSLALSFIEDAAEDAARLAARHADPEVRALFGRLVPTLRRAAADLEECRVLTQPVVARAYATDR